MSYSDSSYLWTGTLEQSPREGTHPLLLVMHEQNYNIFQMQAKTGKRFTWSKVHLMELQLPEIKLRKICKNLHCLRNLQRL